MLLSDDDILRTGRWIAAHQRPSGEIYWWQGDKSDPWNHTHAAMALLLAGMREEADAAYRFLVNTQMKSGGWPMERRGDRSVDDSQDTNQAAYIATGAWFHYLATNDLGFLTDLWPTIERAIDFVVEMQLESGAIAWVRNGGGKVWRAPLLAGSGSIYGSLVCAERIAARINGEKPAWNEARVRLGDCLRGDLRVFEKANLPERAGRYAMDWYYPVLGGALRGEAGRQRMTDPFWTERFSAEGLGCRCVADDRKWFTVAESSELVMSYDVVGLTRRSREIFSTLQKLRRADGGYWTGWSMPTGVIWPLESTTYTAAAVVIANDALARRTSTSGFFREIGGDDGLVERRVAAS
jgi:hypothetical protein